MLNKFTIFLETATPFTAGQEPIWVFVTWPEVRVEAWFFVIAVNNDQFCFVEVVIVVNVNLTEFPHDRPETAALPIWQK